MLILDVLLPHNYFKRFDLFHLYNILDMFISFKLEIIIFVETTLLFFVFFRQENKLRLLDSISMRVKLLKMV
jgi:hypothetical protein